MPAFSHGRSQAPAHAKLLAVAVGNTRTRFGLFTGEELSSPTSLPSADAAAIAAKIDELAQGDHTIPVVLSTVNKKASIAIESELEAREFGVLEINQDVAVPMVHALDDATTVGQDRLLCAYAAFIKTKQACVVIDAGTAITVDFVDGAGTFQGGAILPGVRLLLTSMHEHTAALPLIEEITVDPARGVFGKDTRHAMVLGARAAAVGAARYLIDQYAQAYEAYPQIIATGGDAGVLFENDDLIEHIVPDLQLVGILEAAKAHDQDGLGDDDDEGDGTGKNPRENEEDQDEDGEDED
jgi:type III pantothenate kinase